MMSPPHAELHAPRKCLPGHNATSERRNGQGSAAFHGAVIRETPQLSTCCCLMFGTFRILSIPQNRCSQACMQRCALVAWFICNRECV